MSKTILAAIIIIVLVVAIGGGYYVIQLQQQEAEQEKIRKTLVVGTTDKIERGIEPAYCVSPTEFLVMKHICESLYYQDPATLEVTPNLATDFPTVSTDGLTWDIPVRDDVKFTDGTPFNASCVKFSFERCIDLEGPTWDIWYGMIDKIEVPGTYTVRIVLKEPYGPYLRVLASGWNGIVSPSAVNNMGEEAFQAAPVGSGPFKFSSWTRDVEVVLEINKDYWGEKTKVDKLVYKTIKDSATLKLAIEKGEIDIATRVVLFVDTESLKNNPDVVVLERPSTFEEYIAFNMRRIPKEVREAVAYALDYDDVMSRVYLDNAERAYSIIPPPILGYKPVLEKYSYDPDKAKELLEPLGYTPENPFKCELLYTSQIEWNKDLVVVLKDHLADVGIDAEIKFAEWATFIDFWVAGSFDMLLCCWWMDYPDPDALTWGMLKSDTYCSMWGGYNNSRMDELILQGREVVDEAQRIEIYEEIQDIYAEDLPYVHFSYTNEFGFLRPNVKGYVLPFVPFITDLTTVYKEQLFYSCSLIICAGRNYMGLKQYIVGRLLATIPMVFVSMTAIFVVMRIIPGDPVRAILGPKATEEMVNAMRHQLGLDKTILVQYFEYVTNLLRGDLGKSITTRQPVIVEMAQRFPITLELAIGGIIIAIIIGVYTGVVSAIRKNSAVDHSCRIYAFLVYSLPVFWLGLLFQIVFGVVLDVLPIYGIIDPFIDRPPVITGLHILDGLLAGNLPAFVSGIQHMILPWITVGLLLSTIISRVTRTNMIESLGQDYIAGARAKGTPENVVIYKHALRNALLPVVTVIGLEMAWMLAGSVLTEYVFSIPGMGMLLISAIYNRDFPMIQGIVVMYALMVALVSLIIDILYAFLDPRIRY